MTKATVEAASLADFSSIDGVACPCGSAQRAFGDPSVSAIRFLPTATRVTFSVRQTLLDRTSKGVTWNTTTKQPSKPSEMSSTRPVSSSLPS